jgi:5'-methylthioadenosine phosphorylase
MLEERGLEDEQELAVETPFGLPSDRLRVGRLEGVETVFLARHGENHTILPSEINYRANIYALKKLGVNQIISAAAVGSLKDNIKPGDFVDIWLTRDSAKIIIKEAWKDSLNVFKDTLSL